MALPKSLTLHHLALAKRGHPRVDATHIDYDVVAQGSQLNWCWAAVSAAMSAYYDGGAGLKKCAIANAVIGGTDPSGCVLHRTDSGAAKDCCRPKWGVDIDACKTPGSADKYGRLACGLVKAGHLAPPLRARAMSFEEVKTQIDAKRPAGMRIAWKDGGAHFVAVIGYDAGPEQITIADPWQAGSYTTKPASRPFRATGTWTHSYWTRPRRPQV